MEVYLDNSATTKVCPAAADAALRVMRETFANPSSKHRAGFLAERELKEAAKIIAGSLHCSEKELIFTSGGTESDNMAIFGTAASRARKGRHFITTGIEHPAVLMPFAELEKQGCEVTYLRVSSEGLVSVESVKNALRPDTVLVSVMMVNNETGSRQPVEEIGTMLKKEAPDVYFHVDAVQGFGKYRIKPAVCGIDMLSVSAHKIHGPKGIGLLYVRNGVRVSPLLYGGGQQRDLRPGTENVPGIAAMAAAVSDIYSDFDNKIRREYNLKKRLTEGLLSMEGVTVNGQSLPAGAPHIVSASFEGIKSEVLLHALEERGIYVSSGSACASNHPGLSGTLKAMGLTDAAINGTIRFSLCADNNEEEIDYTLNALGELLPALRRFVRK